MFPFADVVSRDALALKQDEDSALVSADIITVVDSLVKEVNPPQTTLKGMSEDFMSRIEELEIESDKKCGAHCLAGHYVKVKCDGNGQATECAACPEDSWSLGGLPTACRYWPCSRSTRVKVSLPLLALFGCEQDACTFLILYCVGCAFIFFQAKNAPSAPLISTCPRNARPLLILYAWIARHAPRVHLR